MKGFILASLFSLAYAAIVILIFRIRLPERRAALMVRVYFLCLIPLVACLLISPPDLWFLPASLSEQNGWIDSAFSIFTFSASVFGGWLQLYNLADRGLSLRILIDAMENPENRVSPQHLVRAYGGGRGIRWMYGERLAGLVRLRLISRDGDAVAITKKGLRNAHLIHWLRRQYSIPLQRVRID